MSTIISLLDLLNVKLHYSELLVVFIITVAYAIMMLTWQHKYVEGPKKIDLVQFTMLFFAVIFIVDLVTLTVGHTFVGFFELKLAKSIDVNFYVSVIVINIIVIKGIIQKLSGVKDEDNIIRRVLSYIRIVIQQKQLNDNQDKNDDKEV